jgi:hypothetical protein
MPSSAFFLPLCYSQHSKRMDNPKPAEHLFGQFVATAVAGNDLMSSLLFTTGLTAFYAGNALANRLLCSE